MRSALLIKIDDREEMMSGCAKWNLPEFTRKLEKMKVEEIEVRICYCKCAYVSFATVQYLTN